MMERKSSRYI